MKEKIKTSFHRVKTHLSENKEVYITGGVCLAVGVAVGYSLGNADKINNSPTAVVVGNNNTVDQSTIITVVRNGHPGKALLDVSTGIQYPSIKTASKLLGVSRTEVYKMMDSGVLEHLGDAVPDIT